MLGSKKEKAPKILCLAWAPYSARMSELSAEIGGKKEIFTYMYGRFYLAPFRYFLLFVRTVFILAKERPDVVYAQNPAIFCPISCLMYCKTGGRKLIIDHHAVWSMKTFSSGFLGRVIRFLERFVASKSFANTAPHPLWAKELEKMGARRVLTIYDYVATNEIERDETIRGKYSDGKKFIALAPHGGHPLERIENEINAARSFEQLTLLLTGPPSKLNRRMEEIVSATNSRYLGFLEKDEYEKLKGAVDFGLNISDEPYTISHSLLEFASIGIPAISSPQEAVKMLFQDSLLYTQSSEVQDIRKAIKSMLSNPNAIEDYTKRIKRKQMELKLKRQQEIESLRNLMM